MPLCSILGMVGKKCSKLNFLFQSRAKPPAVPWCRGSSLVSCWTVHLDDLFRLLWTLSLHSSWSSPMIDQIQWSIFNLYLICRIGHIDSVKTPSPWHNFLPLTSWHHILSSPDAPPSFNGTERSLVPILGSFLLSIFSLLKLLEVVLSTLYWMF